MSRSRTDEMKRRRASRRRKLLLWNTVLLGGVVAVVAWNVWASSPEETMRGASPDAERPAAGEAEPAERGEGTGSPGAQPSNGDAEPNGDTEPNEDTEPNAGAETPPADAPDPASPGSVRLAFVGDVLLGEYVGTLLERNGFDYPYTHVREVLQAADIAMANLETAVTEAAGEKPGLKTYEFRSDPAALPAFREAGFDLVNLANNHTLDFGPEALRDTMRHLDENGLLHVGAGENADEAFAPEYIEAGGLRIAVFGFSRVIPDTDWKAGKDKLGLADTYNYTRPVEEIRKAAETADLVVVLTHWGDEGTEEPHPQEQVELGRRFVDAGAHLVVGSHPHVLQGFERYGDGWIAYSLGNFIFTKSKNPLTYDTGILEATCGKGGECELRMVPFRADTPQPQPMDGESRAALLRKLSGLSAGAEVLEDGTIEATTQP